MINGESALSGMREDRRMSKSSTITSRSGLLHNPHPGEILLEEFLKPMGLSQNALARAVHVAPRRINEIVLGNGMSPLTPTFGSRAILACRKVSFSACRWITI
jgi:addiction module antidote protein, HigA family